MKNVPPKAKLQKFGKYALTVVVIIACGWAAIKLAEQLSAGDAFIKAAGQNEINAWKEISSASSAGAFLNKHYRPCIQDTVIPAMGRGGTVTIVRNAPSVCGAAVLALAERSFGKDFASEVDLVLVELPTLTKWSPEVEKKMKALIEAYSVFN